jgi:hypothetical protein
MTGRSGSGTRIAADGPWDRVNAVAFSLDGKLVASASHKSGSEIRPQLDFPL